MTDWKDKIKAYAFWLLDKDGMSAIDLHTLSIMFVSMYGPGDPPSGNGSTPPNGNGEPPPDPEPYLIDFDNLPTNNIIVEVNTDTPLREWYRTNDNGFPVWGMFGKRVIPDRIKPKQGKKLVVWKDPIKGDGGNYAYELASGQIVDGTYIYLDNTGTLKSVDESVFSSPNRTRLYILVRHTE